MPDTILRAFDAQVEDVKTKTRTVVARICTEDVDRFNSVFVVRGGRIENYLKSGAVLWEHGKDPRRVRDPIGRNEWLKKDGGSAPREIIAKTRFLEDDFSNQRYEWYRDDILRAFSIGALPDLDKCGPATKEEIRANPSLGQGQYSEYGGGPGVLMYRSWELTEYSGTSVPGNANALTTERAVKLLACIERGLWLPDDAKSEIERIAATAPPEPVLEKPIVRTAPYVEEREGLWHVRNMDGTPCMSFRESGLAEECLRLLSGGPSISHQVTALVGEMRALEAARSAEIKEYVDLYRYGKV